MSADEVKEQVVEEEKTESSKPKTKKSKAKVGKTEETPSEETVQSEDDVKRSGVKEQAANADVMAIEKEKSDDSEKPRVAAKPSFFVEEDKNHRVDVDILSNVETGQVVSVSRTGLGINFEDEFGYLHHERVWFEFTTPTYEDMSTYRQRSGVYRQQAGSVIIDKLQLRNFLLVWHLKDWSLTDVDGNKVELTHENSGALSDASMKKVYGLHPTIIDVVLTTFEKDILLT